MLGCSRPPGRTGIADGARLAGPPRHTRGSPVGQLWGNENPWQFPSRRMYYWRRPACPGLALHARNGLNRPHARGTVKILAAAAGSARTTIHQVTEIPVETKHGRSLW